MKGLTALGIALVATAAALAGGCRREGCVGGDDGNCQPPSACAPLSFSCDGTAGKLSVGTLGDDSPRPATGPKAMGTTGDIVLENGLVRVVLDDPAHAQNLSPSGGTILDFAPVSSGAAGDQTNAIFQAAGVLPRDAVVYETRIYDHHTGQRISDEYVFAVFRGHLAGDSRVTVVTRYELRACEPGVRVSTDLYNGAPDANTLFLADGFFWGDNTMAPFAAGQGLGFRAPEIDLLHLDRAWREWPLVAARSQAPPDVAYAVVPCDRSLAAGFTGTTLTAVGVPLAPVLPGDGIHYERFIVATPGPGIAPAVGVALFVRSKLHGEPVPVEVTGRIVASGQRVEADSGRAASLLIYEPALGPDPDDPARRTPWSEAVPDADGIFRVTLPPRRSYRAQPFAFGLPAAPPTSFSVGEGSADLGDITIPAAARLTVTVRAQPGSAGQQKLYAELVLIRVTPFTGSPPSMYGLYPGCDPMLGPPHGGSGAACNRMITDTGMFKLLVPPGSYFVYATRGPFATLDRREITVQAGEEKHLDMLVELLPGLLPDDAVSADLHVHGAASYDSAIPDQDRVASFLAAGIDVVVATDHDVITTYANALTQATQPIVIIPGVEQTPNILWFAVPGEDFPKTLGHFNFWPLEPDALLPRHGALWDELREPGELMDDAERMFSDADRDGIRQLNHPFGGTKLGRDTGFLRAIGYDPRTPITPGAGFAADVLLRSPAGGKHNIDWDVQEVMTGASRADWLRYRALWFSLLSQGFLRAGAANSDSHSLALERVGYPRNVVFGVRKGMVDVKSFDDHVRRGHMIGTNGPILEVAIESPGKSYSPGIHKDDWITPVAGAALSVSVRAAPWIPVDEIRIFVNGALAMPPIDISATFKAAAHLGSQIPAVKLALIPLDKILPSKDGRLLKDSWIVVEAGLKQATPPDVDDDGLPDLPDADVEGRPSDDGAPRFDLEAIAPGVWPVAFSNPFIIDVDGDGWRAPGLP